MEGILEAFPWAQRIFQHLADRPTSIHPQRMLNREQGRALELIGHGVDYLLDCYLFQGGDNELIDVGGFANDAIQILISMRRQILMPIHVPVRTALRSSTPGVHRDFISCPSDQTD